MTAVHQFTLLKDAYPPKNVLIEWITPSGQMQRGRWLGGMVWMPENSPMYVYYTPISWRIVVKE
jgi:hypothetical protein